MVIWSIDLEGKFTYTQYRADGEDEPGDRIGKSALEIYKGTEVETFLRKVLSGEKQNDILKVGEIYYDTRVSPLYNSNKEITGYLGISLDITQRIKTENELKKFKLVLDQAPAAVFIVDKKSNFEYINPFFTKISGYTEADLLQQNINERLYNGEVPESRREIFNTLREGNTWQGELLTRNKNGSMYWANTIAAPYIDESGNTDGYIVIQQDITEQKNMLNAIKEREQLHRTLIEDSLEGVVITQDFNFIFINKVFCDMLGYTLDEIKSIVPSSVLAPEDKERVMGYHQKRMLGEQVPHIYVADFIRKDGTRFTAEMNSAGVEIGGKPASYITMRDITEKSIMEKALRISEEKYRRLFEAESDAIFLVDLKDGSIIDSNPAASRIYGYSHDELISLKNIDLSAEPEKTAKATKERQAVVPLRFHRKKDGTVFPVELSAGFTEFEGREVQIITSRDISERIKMQEALSNSEKKYRELTEMLPQTVYELDLNGNIIYTNQAGFETFGIDERDFGTSAFRFFAPEYHEKMKENLQLSISNNISTSGNEYIAVRSNGERFPVMVFSVPMLSDGKPVGTRGIILDISEHVEMQNAIRNSEKKYRELTEMLPQTVYELDLKGNIIYMNQTGLKTFAITPEDYGTPAYNFIVPEQHEKMASNMKKSIHGNFTTPGNEYMAIKKNGQKFPVMIFAGPMIIEGKVTGTRGIILDMTEHEAMQVALRESEQKYKTLVENSQDGICITQDGMFKFVNKSFCIMLGYKPEELYEIPVKDTVEPSYLKQIADLNESRAKGVESVTNYSLQLIRKDKRIIDVSIESSWTEFGGRPASFDTLHDITESKRIQAALMESEAKYRELVEKTNSIILIWDNNFNITFLNEYGLKFFGYNKDEIINKSMVGTIVPKTEQNSGRNLKELMKLIFAGPENYAQNINENIRKNGERVWVSWNNTAIRDENGEILNMFSVGTDITERRRNEEELRITKEKLQKLNLNLEKKVVETANKLTEANTQLIRLQKENLQSQFEVLRQQVNPHFLFNSLNVLTSLIKLEPDLAEKFTEHLSKVYRYVLENKDNDLVSLGTELDFLDAYLFLLNIRFMDKIKVDISIGEKMKEMLILPLALQLIIENAIKHNTMSKKAPLIIQIFIDNNLMLNIINNLQEREAQMISTGVGLKNITHRYELLELPAPEFFKTDTQFIAKIPLKVDNK